jgi:hypothetical protein
MSNVSALSYAGPDIDQGAQTLNSRTDAMAGRSRARAIPTGTRRAIASHTEVHR